MMVYELDSPSDVCEMLTVIQSRLYPVKYPCMQSLIKSSRCNSLENVPVDKIYG